MMMIMMLMIMKMIIIMMTGDDDDDDDDGSSKCLQTNASIILGVATVGASPPPIPPNREQVWKNIREYLL